MTFTAKNLPAKMPTGATYIEYQAARLAIKAMYVPRPPKDGERMIVLRRPQTGSYTFASYARGDLLRLPSGNYWVVTAARDGYSRAGEGWKVWEQMIIARPAIQADHDAVAQQAAAQVAESQSILDAMMNR